MQQGRIVDRFHELRFCRDLHKTDGLRNTADASTIRENVHSIEKI